MSAVSKRCPSPTKGISCPGDLYGVRMYSMFGDQDNIFYIQETYRKSSIFKKPTEPPEGLLKSQDQQRVFYLQET